MKTLKEAMALAGITPGQIASLESNGYCIAPLEATDEMAKVAALTCAHCDGGIQECTRKVVNAALAARPKIED